MSYNNTLGTYTMLVLLSKSFFFVIMTEYMSEQLKPGRIYVGLIFFLMVSEVLVHYGGENTVTAAGWSMLKGIYGRSVS